MANVGSTIGDNLGGFFGGLVNPVLGSNTTQTSTTVTKPTQSNGTTTALIVGGILVVGIIIALIYFSS